MEARPVQRQMHDLERAGADETALQGPSSLGPLGKIVGEWRDADIGREMAVAANGHIDPRHADASLAQQEDKVRKLMTRSPVEERVHWIPRRDDVGSNSPQVLSRAVQLVETFS